MATPPARTELADTYPNPSNAVFRTGIGKLWDYVTERLGASGSAADARSALGIGSAITFRNLLINAGGWINQRGYVSATATGAANAYTLDRWRVVTSGQNLAFTAAAPDATMTAPAGGLEQVIEGASVIGGVYTLSWTGTATATVNGSAITNGGNSASLPANTNITVRFSGGTVLRPQFELGTVATPFERRLPGVELQLCQRYYQVVTVGLQMISAGAGAEYGYGVTHAPMRITPSFGYGGGPSIVNASSEVYTPTSNNSGRYKIQAGGAAAGSATYILDRAILLSAEL